MNSIEEKKHKTIREAQFDRRLQETKKQIDQIFDGIEIKKHLGENSYVHHTGTKAFYLDEVVKCFEGKGYIVKMMPTESVVSYKIYVGW
ncbi:MAG: hypothetical protein KBT02_03750 [Treponema sp.]|nr:hypothetical protein [Candidatus Treponema caballi]